MQTLEEDAVDEINDFLDDVRYFDFFQDGCAAMARNAKLLLELAGEPVTPDNLLRIVCTSPRYPKHVATPQWRSSYCNKMLKEAHNRRLQNHREKLTIDVLDYFLGYLPTRSHEALSMLEAAFTGVLGSMTWSDETDRAPEPAPVPERKRGWLERWAATRGL